MLKTIIAGALVAGFAMPAAAQNRATITKIAIGCPTIAGTVAAYRAGSNTGGDTRAFLDIIAAYDCEKLAKGRDLTLISAGSDVALVIVRGKRVYVPAHSISAH
jgi:hypothetical protein